MASSSRILPDPKDLLSEQIIESIKFVDWAKDEAKRLQNDHDKQLLLLELAGDCYALALRNLSDHLLTHERRNRSRR